MDMNSLAWAQLHDAISRLAEPDEFASMLAWCESYIDAELDTIHMTPRQIVTEAINAYRASRQDHFSGER